jgi:3-isopropylmalate dehydrogenase
MAERIYEIALVPGDGTGPEVVAEGVKVLKAVSARKGFGLVFRDFDLGADHYKRTGETLTTEVLEALRKCDAIYLGAIGDPDVPPGILEKGILLRLRFELDQYINLRPVKLYPGVETPIKNKGPEEIDFLVVRENTEGLYAGSGGILRRGTAHEVAVQESVSTRMGVERCIRYAFEACKDRGRTKKLTLCGKTNVLTYTFDLWERTFHEVAEEYPDIKTDYMHVDALCMWMIKDPDWFDVIVTENMFGDIITDLGAMLQGGLGVAAGGNINPDGVSMFEPIGGSSPKYAGKNIINPLGAILAGKLMLESLGERSGAQMIEDGVAKVLREDLTGVAAGQMGHATAEVGDLVVDFINK